MGRSSWRVTSRETTQAEADRRHNVDVSTVIGIRRTVKDAALAALAARPGRRAKERDWELEQAETEVAQMTEAVKSQAIGLGRLLGWLRGLGGVERVGVEQLRRGPGGPSRRGGCCRDRGAAPEAPGAPRAQVRSRGWRGGRACGALIRGHSLPEVRGRRGGGDPDSARCCAVEARTGAVNQLKSLLVTAPSRSRPLWGSSHRSPALGCGPILAAARPPPRPTVDGLLVQCGA